MLVTAGRGTDVCRQGAMEWVEAWQSKAPAPQKLGLKYPARSRAIGCSATAARDRPRPR